MIAHAVHYTVVVVGMLGLLALLGPQWVGGPPSRGPRDEHESRVADLHQQIATGALGTATLVRHTAVVGHQARSALPVLIVSSAAAAGVHAALGPMHLRELLAFGIFFMVSAIAQLTWSLLMVLTPTRGLLVAGVLGNTAILLLWLATRTVGLPFGLMPSPEPVGPWDLTCALWQTVIVMGGLRLLRQPEARMHVAGYDDWPVPARLWLFGSMFVLAVLTVSGAGG